MKTSKAIRFVFVTTMALAAGAMVSCSHSPLQPAEESLSSKFLTWAKTPPMGWNSWDSFGAGVSEAETRENADYMADKLKSHGWQYVVVDIQWYEPQAHTDRYRPNAELTMDEYGRLLPAPNRFPSAADGKGFKALADYVHSKGLKFGIHLMRGIPRQAVKQNTQILGTNLHAADIANTSSTCRWNTDMYGVDMSKPGAQEYYNSVFNLIASWDVDFVKVDDLSRPYSTREIEAIRAAIDQTHRQIVFSTSPGATPLDQGDHISQNANMWRISDDFWDRWPPLKAQFERCANWAKFNAPGHFPDADMLPFGAIRTWRTNDNWTRFTRDEQITVMSLWSICRSPLMMGGHMPKNDEFTLSLLVNDEVIAVNQHSSNSHQIFRDGDKIAWVADSPTPQVKYLAVFNAADKPQDSGAPDAAITVNLSDVGMTGRCRIDDLWTGKSAGLFTGEFAPAIPYHGAGLYRVTRVN
jgi:hypothetical protein